MNIPSIFKKEAVERAIEKVAVALIKRQFGPGSTRPVLLSDEHIQSDDIAATVVHCTRDEAVVIDPNSQLLNTDAYDLEVEDKAMTGEDPEVASKRWRDISLAMLSTDPTGIDLSRFADFVVFPRGSESETEEKSRKRRKRKFRICITEDFTTLS